MIKIHLKIVLKIDLEHNNLKVNKLQKNLSNMSPSELVVRCEKGQIIRIYRTFYILHT